VLVVLLCSGILVSSWPLSVLSTNRNTLNAQLPKPPFPSAAASQPTHTTIDQHGIATPHSQQQFGTRCRLTLSILMLQC